MPHYITQLRALVTASARSNVSVVTSFLTYLLIHPLHHNILDSTLFSPQGQDDPPLS